MAKGSRYWEVIEGLLLGLLGSVSNDVFQNVRCQVLITED